MLIDIETAAQLLQCHRRVIGNWIVSGKLPSKEGKVSTNDLLKVECLDDSQKKTIQAYVNITLAIKYHPA